MKCFPSFISYSSENYPITLFFVSQLGFMNFNVNLDSNRINLGDNLIEKQNQKLKAKISLIF